MVSGELCLDTFNNMQKIFFPVDMYYKLGQSNTHLSSVVASSKQVLKNDTEKPWLLCYMLIPVVAVVLYMVTL